MVQDFTIQRRLHKGKHTRTFIIKPAPRSGWEFVDRLEDQIVRRLELSDWHRVERTRDALNREVRTLLSEGWTENSPVVDGSQGGTSRA